MPTPNTDTTDADTAEGDAPIGAPHLFAFGLFAVIAFFILHPDGTIYTYAALSVAGLLLVFLPFVSGIAVLDWLRRR